MGGRSRGDAGGRRAAGCGSPVPRSRATEWSRSLPSAPSRLSLSGSRSNASGAKASPHPAPFLALQEDVGCIQGARPGGDAMGAQACSPALGDPAPGGGCPPWGRRRAPRHPPCLTTQEAALVLRVTVAVFKACPPFRERSRAEGRRRGAAPAASRAID